MDIAESIYEDVVEPSYKNQLGHSPNILVTAGKREDNSPCRRFTPWWLRELVSAENDMYIARQANRKPVLSTAQVILLINTRSWGTLW